MPAESGLMNSTLKGTWKRDGDFGEGNERDPLGAKVKKQKKPTRRSGM